MSKQLYRSQKNKMLSGVCSGIADYLNVDATVIRLFWIVGSIFAGMGLGGLIAYLICSFIIPVQPDGF